MGKKVLILEDKASTRSFFKSFLITKGLEVDVAEDGLEGLEKEKENNYDLIFSDLEMPNMNGLEFLHSLKTSGNNKEVPVVMLTSVNQEEIIDRARKLGAADYLIKPFSHENIGTVLKKLNI